MVEFLEPLSLGIRVEPGYPLRSIGGRVKTFTTIDINLIPSSSMIRPNNLDCTTLREMKEDKGESLQLNNNTSNPLTTYKSRTVTPTDDEISSVLQRGTLSDLTQQLGTFPWSKSTSEPLHFERGWEVHGLHAALTLMNRQLSSLYNSHSLTPSVVLYLLTPSDSIRDVVTTSLPRPYTEGWLNGKMLRSVYLVVDTNEERGRGRVEEWRKGYPHLTFEFVPYQSTSDHGGQQSEGGGRDRAGSVSTLWGKGRGHDVHASTVGGLRDFLENMARTHVLPSTERVIYTLGGIVSDKRKGIRNFVKGVFFNSSSSSQGGNRGDNGNGKVQYGHGSVESCTSMLAWSLMTARDYAGAVANAGFGKGDWGREPVLKAGIMELEVWGKYAERKSKGERWGDEMSKGVGEVVDTLCGNLEARGEGWGGKERLVRGKWTSVRVRLATRFILEVCGRWGGHCALDGMTANELIRVVNAIGTVARHETKVVTGLMWSVGGRIWGGVGRERKRGVYYMISGYWEGGREGVRRELEGWGTDGWRGWEQVVEQGVYPGSAAGETRPGWDHLTTKRISTLATWAYDEPTVDRRLPLALYLALLRHHTDRTTGDVQRTAINRIYSLAECIGVIKGGWIKVSKVHWGGGREKGGREGTGMEKEYLTEVGSNPSNDKETSATEWFVDFFKRRSDEKFEQSRSKSQQAPLKQQATEESINIRVKVKNNAGGEVRITDIEAVAKLETEDGTMFSNSIVSDEGGEEGGEEKEMESITREMAGVKLDTPTLGKGSPRPLFLTSKTSLNLKSRSESLFTLSLTALSTGKLTVIGWRYKLAGKDKTWVVDDFDVGSVPLNDTRANRAGRKRRTLTDNVWEITTNMPDLRLQVDGVKGEKRAGEIGRGKMTIVNEGKADAVNIFLKTNYPWIYVPSPEGWEGVNGRVPNSCGASGTVTDLPIPRITPGSTAVVDMYVFSGILGPQALEMVVRYEGENGMARTAFAREAMNVSPGLALAASAQPGYKNGTDLVTSLEFGNGGEEDVKVEDVVISTPHVKVGREGIMGSGEEVVVGVGMRAVKNLILQGVGKAGEVIVTNSDASPVPDKDKAALAFFSLLHSNAEFLRRVTEWEMEREREEKEGFQPKSIQEIRRANTAATRGRAQSASGMVCQPTSIASTVDPEACNVNVVVKWKAGDRVGATFEVLEIRGRTYKSRCPFVVTANYEPNVKFVAGGVEKRLDVLLYNRLFSEEEVQFRFDVGDIEGVEISGKKAFRGKLRGGEQITVRLRAMYNSPGIFNLQNIKVQVGEIPFLFSFQWAVEVK